MKPFKTHRQQLKILRDRGLSIPDGSKAMRILERENYYGLINGYKDLFLQVDTQGNPLLPEQYKAGATFEEIHKLYCFDRDLRNILIEALLKFETNVKTKISHYFTEKFKEPNAYLDMTNYSRDPKNLKTILKVIATISSEISRRSDRNNSAIKHYLDNHDGVPFWILMKYLTIGNMQYFYVSLDDSLQNKIAKSFADSFKNNYNQRIHFTADELRNILIAANFFRNLCAHEERLYNYRIKDHPRSAQIAVHLNMPVSILSKGNLFSMVAFLKLVISKKDYQVLISKLKKLFDLFKTSFTSVNFDEVLIKMGFPSEWAVLL